MPIIRQNIVAASPKKDSHHLADEGGSRTVQSKKITTWLVFHSLKGIKGD